MSLDVLAQHLASKGRNGDSMLVHMTPGEVHGLHALALAHGGQLTINPETGLPEANFLKKLLPMIAGFALGPAGFGLMSSLGAAATVGGVTALATGSLQKGLMAGLGAYGGSGLGEAFAGAGASAAGAASIEAAQKLALERGLEGEAANQFVQQQVAKSVADYGAKPLMERLAGGFDVAKAAPLDFAKSVAKPLMYAAAPVLADQGVQTTTPRESKPGDTGYVRPFVYDAATFGQGPQGLQALAPIPANQISYPAPPPGGANGGLVAFANGGPVMPSDIAGYTAEQKADLYNRFLSQGFGDAAIRQAAGVQTDSAWKTLQDLAAQRGSPDISGAQRYALTTPNWQSRSGETGLPGLNSNIVRWFAENPNATRQQVESEMGKWQLSDADLQRATGQSLNQRFAAAPAPATNMDKYKELNQLAVQIAQAPAAARQTGTAVGALPSSALSAVKNDTVAQYLNDKFLTDDERRAMRLMLDVSTPGGVQAIYDTINAYDPSGGIAKSLGYTPPAAAPGPVTGGTVTGGGVFTSRTDTTPTFQLAPAEQVMKTPVGTITGGTVSGAVDTQKALDDYNRTAPTGKPVDVIDAGTRAGYKGTDKTYGGTDKLDQIKLAPLGEAGKVTRGTETMQDVRNAVDNRYAAPVSVFQYTPSVTGASKSAYDYLMGKGEYPTQQTLPGNAPLWRPYVQNVATPPSSSDAFVSRTAPTTATSGAQFGFTPPTGSTGMPTTGTQRWKNTRTGEIYLAPSGYKPPSNDWVLDDNTTDLTNSGVGVGGGPGIGGADGTDGGAGGSGANGGNGANGGRVYAGRYNVGGITALAGGGQYNLGSYSDGGRLLRGPGDGVSDSIPATIGAGQPARLADGEFVIPARIVSELGNGSTEAGARKLYAMMDRVQRARGKTTGKNKVAANTKAERFLPA